MTKLPVELFSAIDRQPRADHSMPDFVITCPTPACGKPLRLPSEALGKPLSCPYCRTPLKVSGGTDGSPPSVSAPGQILRVPRLLLIPGFALLILGIAGAFVNGAVASDCLLHPGVERGYAAQYVREYNSLDEQLSFGKARKKDDDASELELFMAAAGGGAGATVMIAIDEAMTDAWATRMTFVHSLSTITALLAATGGVCILRGKGYWIAFLGCIAAMATVGQACCIPGVVPGIWGLLVLVRDDARLHFGIRPKL